jgi:hypothetical protein
MDLVPGCVARAKTSGLVWGGADSQADVDAGGWGTFLPVATAEQFRARILAAVSCSDGTRASRDFESR